MAEGETQESVRRIAERLGAGNGSDLRLSEEGAATRIESTLGAVDLSAAGIDRDWGQRPAGVHANLERLVAALRGSPFVLGFPEEAGAILRHSPSTSSWVRAVRLTEAVSVLAEEAAARGDRTAEVRLPAVHRARFLLLSAPEMRSGGHSDGRGQPLGPTLDERAQQARSDWLRDLLNHDDHPHLRKLTSQQIDEELRSVADYGPVAGGAVERAIVREAFLPRFMLTEVYKRLRRPARWAASAIFALLVAVTAVWLLAVAGRLSSGARALWLSGVLAGLAYALIVAAALFDEVIGYLACLRLPAGAAVGTLALLSFGSGWLSTPGPWWSWASLALVISTWGYLMLEARAHGAGRWAAPGRAALVALVGFAHALAVNAIVIPVVGRALVDGLSANLSSLDGRAVGHLLTLAASVSLAAGVFVQVLWDDRPITYPLTHLAWSGRRSP